MFSARKSLDNNARDSTSRKFMTLTHNNRRQRVNITKVVKITFERGKNYWEQTFPSISLSAAYCVHSNDAQNLRRDMEMLLTSVGFPS